MAGIVILKSEATRSAPVGSVAISCRGTISAFLISILASGCSPSPAPDALTDRQIRQLSVGSWRQEAAFPPGTRVERRITFREDGEFDESSRLISGAATFDYRSSGVWIVQDRVLYMALRDTTAPDLVHPGTVSARIVRMDEREAVTEGETGATSRMRRETPAAKEAPLSTNAPGATTTNAPAKPAA